MRDPLYSGGCNGSPTDIIWNCSALDGPDEEEYVHAAVRLASEYACPVVATNDVRFLDASEFEAHEARVCIGDGRTLDDPRRARTYSEQQYLRSPEEMADLFKDIPEALENTVEIARRCSVSLSLGEPFLPNYPVPEGEGIEQFLSRLSFEGLGERFPGQSDQQLTVIVIGSTLSWKPSIKWVFPVIS